MTNIPWLAMLIGIISTTQLHLAKAMQKHGIVIFQKSRKMEIQKEEEININTKIKKPIIYIVGIILNYTIFIWASLATSYGLASHYASMFGVGLIILLLYAATILKERINSIEYIGAIILFSGTLLLGFENIKQPLVDKTLINYTGSYTFFLIFIIVSSLVIYVVGKFKLKSLRSILFGLISGIYGGLDPIFKELGLAFDQGDGLFPVHLIGWFFYVVSFIIGFGAFFLTQLGFSKKVEASVLVPVYNSAFVTFPIIFQMISYPNYVPSIITILGIIICITGIFLMQISKRYFSQINEDIPKK